MLCGALLCYTVVCSVGGLDRQLVRGTGDVTVPVNDTGSVKLSVQ